MAISASEISRIVWAETKAFGPSSPQSPNLTNVRRLIARLAAATDGAGMQREDLPSGSDPTWGETVREILGLVRDAANAGPEEERILIWPSTDGARPAVDPPPPAPWRDAAMPAPIGPFTLGDGRQVMVFRRPAVPNDGAPFASVIWRWRRAETTRVHPQPNRTFALWLTAAALVLFAFGSFCAYQLGAAAHQVVLRFAAAANLATAAKDARPGAVACSVQPAANLPVVIPADWLRKDNVKDASGTPVPGCATLWHRVYHGFLDDKMETRWSRMVLAWFSESGGTFSILWPFVIIEASLVLLFVAAGYGIIGRPLGAIIDDRYRMSLTLGQLCLWSILLFAGLTALGLCNIGFGGQVYAELQKMAALPPAPGEDQVDWGTLASNYNFFPKMMAPFLTLLGFATASPVIATFIMRPTSTAATEKAIMDDGAAASRATADYLDKNSSSSEAALEDLVVKEVAGRENLVDIVRLQHVAITALLVVGYGYMLVDAVSGLEPLVIAKALVARAPLFGAMPPVDSTFLTLLGISHTALLGGKYFDRQTAAPAPAPGGQG